MREDRLGLAQRTRCFFLHDDLACPVEQALLFQLDRYTVPLPHARDAPDTRSCRAVIRLDVTGKAVHRLQFRARANDVGRGHRQGEPFHQACESHLSLHLQEGVKLGERDTHADRQLILHLREEERLLVHRQQHIVALPCEVIEDELEVPDGVRSHSRAAIVAPDKAGEAADAQRIGVAYIEDIATPAQGSNRLSRREARPL
jgi:hypothetical protein